MDFFSSISNYFCGSSSLPTASSTHRHIHAIAAVREPKRNDTRSVESRPVHPRRVSVEKEYSASSLPEDLKERVRSGMFGFTFTDCCMRKKNAEQILEDFKEEFEQVAKWARHIGTPSAVEILASSRPKVFNMNAAGPLVIKCIFHPIESDHRLSDDQLYALDVIKRAVLIQELKSRKFNDDGKLSFPGNFDPSKHPDVVDAMDSYMKQMIVYLDKHPDFLTGVERVKADDIKRALNDLKGSTTVRSDVRQKDKQSVGSSPPRQRRTSVECEYSASSLPENLKDRVRSGMFGFTHTNCCMLGKNAERILNEFKEEFEQVAKWARHIGTPSAVEVLASRRPNVFNNIFFGPFVIKCIFDPIESGHRLSDDQLYALDVIKRAVLIQELKSRKFNDGSKLSFQDDFDPLIEVQAVKAMCSYIDQIIVYLKEHPDFLTDEERIKAGKIASALHELERKCSKSS